MKSDRRGGNPRARLRRWLKLGSALALLAAVALFLSRTQLVGAAAGAVLRLAGASDVKLSVAQASLWRVVLDDVAFNVRTQPFAAKRVTFRRAHWWSPSLGAVRVEQAWLPLTVDGSGTKLTWDTYPGGEAKISAASLPAEQVSIEGSLVIRAAALPEQALAVKIEAALKDDGTWQGTVQAGGPGLHLAGEAVIKPAAREAAFAVPRVRVELKAWQDFIKRVVFLPGGYWEMDGVVTAEVSGAFKDGKLTAAGPVRMRGGRFANPERRVAATGVDFDLEFEDFDRMRSKPGAVRVTALRSGGLALADFEADIAFESPESVAVSRVAGRMLGGTISTEPFRLQLDRHELDCVVLADGLDLTRILALARDVPAQGVGRVGGRLPIRIDDGGLRLGSGWLEMKKGADAEIQFNAAGLLTRGVDARNPTYPVLQRIETGLLRLKLGALRLDIHPPDRPPGSTARLHLTGGPADPTVKVPVVLDLSVNSPIEKLLDLGLDSRVRIGPGR